MVLPIHLDSLIPIINEAAWFTDQNTDVTGKSFVLTVKDPSHFGSATYYLCLP